MDQIERAAIAMAGGLAEWNRLNGAIRDQYRELARRAAEVLVKPVPWDQVELTARVELTKHSGALTVRRANSTTLDIIARSIASAMKLSKYTVVYGAPSEGANSPTPTPDRRE